MEWMRHKMNSGQVRLEWIPGSQNPADLFTKNVNTALLNLHRGRLGFVTVKDSPVEKLFELSVQRGRIEMYHEARIAMLEVCCSAKSALSQECSHQGIPYAGVIQKMQKLHVYKQACAIVHRWREDGCWVHVHLSTPCSAGSPLKNFTKDYEPSPADVEWDSVMKSAGRYLQLGDACSFELPRYNNVWSRFGTQQTLCRARLMHECHVHLCQTGVRSRSGLPVGKQLRFMSSEPMFARRLHMMFGTCGCVKHAPFGDTDWPSTWYYNQKLARGIIKAASSF